MSTFAKFVAERWKEKLSTWNGEEAFPIQAKEGRWYSTLTGGDPPELEIDWEKLVAEIAELEEEFKRRQVK